MPINIENAIEQATTTVVTDYTPNFFNKTVLTGRGGTSRGLLSLKNNPISLPKGRKTTHDNVYMGKKDKRQGTITITQLPLNPIMPCMYDDYLMGAIPKPDLSKLICIGTDMTNTKNKLYMKMDIHAVRLDKETIPPKNGIGQPVYKQDFISVYQCFFYLIQDPNKDTCEYLSFNRIPSSISHGINMYTTTWTVNPAVELTINGSIYYSLERQFTMNDNEIANYLSNYEIYDAICDCSEIWQTKIDKAMELLFQNINNAVSNNKISTNDAVHYACRQVRYLMNYNIPLNLYRAIYKAIHANFTTDCISKICKQNLNLLLSNTLQSLADNKSKIPSFTAPSGTIQLPASVQKLSKEQHNAVFSKDPLILVQAGAGTGKSTLILGRIDYLIACGVDPKDITVLSFTNAAADNITIKNPNVNSMTIARMIHEIYSLNFAGHELSTLQTLMNSLEIYYPGKVHKTGSVENKFWNRLYSMTRNDANAFTDMNNFIEENYQDVMDILNLIHQTTLELEIIVCYQKIDTLKEPANISSKFLIIDEVQDNSIFEFVYTLKYIDKHKESLFIVGDCSQTLYEFRASNPRALNILEGSGTFTTHQLTVNYRSNQEILDFANVMLSNIEANQYARIQLLANSTITPTEATFLEKVQMNYHQLQSRKDLTDEMPSMFANELKPYIDKCLAKGEQVTFLAATRREIANIQNILTIQYPNHNSVSLIPQRAYNNTLITDYVKKHWENVQFLPIPNFVQALIQDIIANVPTMSGRNMIPLNKAQALLAKWKASEGNQIQSYVNQVTKNILTHNAMLNLVKDNLLQFEIRQNAIRAALLSDRNRQAKENADIQNANFVLSTIHSAKGLEFNNVVVFYKDDSNMSEEDKRMYYVALTRAMKSEYILAYNTVSSPQVLADYLEVLQKLHDRAPAPNSPLTQLLKRHIQI